MLSPDVISMLAGTGIGAVSQILKIRSDQQHEVVKLAIQKSDQSIKESDQEIKIADAAIQRGGENGKWIRRFIVIVIMFAVSIAPLLTSFFNIPIVTETQTERSFLFGLFESSKPVFVQVHGYLLTEEVRAAVMFILSLYFGKSLPK